MPSGILSTHYLTGAYMPSLHIVTSPISFVDQLLDECKSSITDITVNIPESRIEVTLSSNTAVVIFQERARQLSVHTKYHGNKLFHVPV